jgi:hypothetical protein
MLLYASTCLLCHWLDFFVRRPLDGSSLRAELSSMPTEQLSSALKNMGKSTEVCVMGWAAAFNYPCITLMLGCSTAY